MNLRLKFASATRWLLISWAVLGVAGCKKIQNHSESDDEARRSSLLLANYRIDAPPGLIEELDTKRKPKVEAVGYKGEEVLHLLTWTNHIPAAVLDGFYESTGVRVTISLVWSNEDLIERLSKGAPYDVVMPLGYGVERLVEMDLLHELDFRNIPNRKTVDQVFEQGQFDLANRHSVPYLWTTAGIAYNAAYFDRPPRVWGDLFEVEGEAEKGFLGRVSLLPEPMEVFGAALIRLTNSPISTQTNELNNAAEYLARRIDALRIRWMWSELPVEMASERVLLAQAYSGEAGRAGTKNPNVMFAVPEDGTWMSVTYLCVPKRSPPANKRAAEAFINYLLIPAVAGKVVNYAFEASTVRDALPYVDSQIRNGPVYSHPTLSGLHAYTEDGFEYRERLWERLTNRTVARASE